MKNIRRLFGSLGALALIAACGGGSEGPPLPPTGAPGPGPGSQSNDGNGTTETNTGNLEGGDNGTNTETPSDPGNGVDQTAMDNGDTGAMAPGPSPTMPAAGGEIAVGDGNALVPNSEFWVAGATNGAGIQGAFYTFADSDGGAGGDTVIDSFTVDETTGAICVAGTASEVIDMEYGTYYGGGVGLALGDLGAMQGEIPWERGAFTNFSYTLSGPDVPASLRFQVDFDGKAAADTYCQNIGGAAGARTSEFNAATAADGPVLSCWDPTLAAPVPAAAGLIGIQWIVSTAVGSPTTFDFCIENLSVQ